MQFIDETAKAKILYALEQKKEQEMTLDNEPLIMRKKAQAREFWMGKDGFFYDLMGRTMTEAEFFELFEEKEKWGEKTEEKTWEQTRREKCTPWTFKNYTNKIKNREAQGRSPITLTPASPTI